MTDVAAVKFHRLTLHNALAQGGDRIGRPAGTVGKGQGKGCARGVAGAAKGREVHRNGDGDIGVFHGGIVEKMFPLGEIGDLTILHGKCLQTVMFWGSLYHSTGKWATESWELWAIASAEHYSRHRNTVPVSSLFSMVRLPPWSCAICRARARPTPPEARLRD